MAGCRERRGSITGCYLTESEWEYVARADTTGPFHFGSTISTDQANYDFDYIYGNGRKGVNRGQTVPAGSFPSNKFGLHDMHGNVNGSGLRTVGIVITAEHRRTAVRGPVAAIATYACCAAVPGADVPRGLRAAIRYGYDSGFRNSVIGFRVARTLTP